MTVSAMLKLLLPFQQVESSHC